MSPATDSPTQANVLSVLIVGAGALGCAAATALAGSGAETGIRLRLLDHDTVEDSNLQRQVLYSQADIGRAKPEAAVAALRREHPGLAVEGAQRRLTTENAPEQIDWADFVIDATDDPTTKFLINRIAVDTATPFCYGGVVRTRGQVLSVSPGRSACLACVFPEEEADDDGGCSAQGILAPVAGVLGSLQAGAALAALKGSPGPGPGEMVLYDLEGPRWRKVSFSKQSDCPRCGNSARAAAATPRSPQDHRSIQPCPS